MQIEKVKNISMFEQSMRGLVGSAQLLVGIFCVVACVKNIFMGMALMSFPGLGGLLLGVCFIILGSHAVSKVIHYIHVAYATPVPAPKRFWSFLGI